MRLDKTLSTPLCFHSNAEIASSDVGGGGLSQGDWQWEVVEGSTAYKNRLAALSMERKVCHPSAKENQENFASYL